MVFIVMSLGFIIMGLVSGIYECIAWALIPAILGLFGYMLERGY